MTVHSSEIVSLDDEIGIYKFFFSGSHIIKEDQFINKNEKCLLSEPKQIIWKNHILTINMLKWCVFYSYSVNYG